MKRNKNGRLILFLALLWRREADVDQEFEAVLMLSILFQHASLKFPCLIRFLIQEEFRDVTRQSLLINFTFNFTLLITQTGQS